MIYDLYVCLVNGVMVCLCVKIVILNYEVLSIQLHNKQSTIHTTDS